MTPAAALRPGHLRDEAGRQAIPDLTLPGLFTALMGLRDASSVITLHLDFWLAVFEISKYNYFQIKAGGFRSWSTILIDTVILLHL